MFLAGPGVCPRCGLPIVPAFPSMSYPAYSMPVAPRPYSYGRDRVARWRRRTRTGLILSAVGLLILWVPWVSAAGALLVSLGSTFLFMGARAHGRAHHLAVVLAFLALGVGGVLIATLFGAFLLDAADAARRALTMGSLFDTASLLLWGTIPGTLTVIVGLVLQVHYLLAPRQRGWLFAAAMFLALSVLAATVFALPALDTLGDVRVRTGPVIEFLGSLSAYRIVEAPAYVGLAIVYLLAHRGTVPSVGGPRPVVAAVPPP